ncbi:MAG: hypothetical protein US76_00520 [Parcubacteria group bacterium GW2011_GWA2_38_13b]|nr:MAG: hypothetical protein US76_00520 [Parcubacteria group bacterium GW2011_GWA2_38_13b]
MVRVKIKIEFYAAKCYVKDCFISYVMKNLFEYYLNIDTNIILKTANNNYCWLLELSGEKNNIEKTVKFISENLKNNYKNDFQYSQTAAGSIGFIIYPN